MTLGKQDEPLTGWTPDLLAARQKALAAARTALILDIAASVTLDEALAITGWSRANWFRRLKTARHQSGIFTGDGRTIQKRAN